MQLAQDIELGHQVDPVRQHEQVNITAPRLIVNARAEKIDVSLRILGADGSEDGLPLAVVQAHGWIATWCASAAFT